MSLLVHICCGPCAAYPLSFLEKKYSKITGYFYNPNIHPYKEFRKRLDTTQEFGLKTGLEVICHDEYELRPFLREVVYKENKRCEICYRLRLTQAAIKTQELGYSSFTSTLLYSKYQNHDVIKKIGFSIASIYKINFIYEDFREGWQEGIELATKMNLYRQPYCGCIYSEEERYNKKK